MRSQLIRAAILAVALTFSVPHVAFAASVSDGDPSFGSSAKDAPEVPSSSLARTSGGEVGIMQVIPAPSGCNGYANNPHRSTSSPTYGQTKGFSTTQCINSVPFIEVKSEVWRSRWWGYERKGVTGHNYQYNGSFQGVSGIWQCCENNTWRTVGWHHVTDGDGVDYYAETMKYADINSC